MEPKIELEVNKKLEEHRKESNILYSPMIVKLIVFGMVGIILTTALVTMLKSILK